MSQEQILKDIFLQQIKNINILNSIFNELPGITYMYNADGVYLGQSDFKHRDMQKYCVPKNVIGRSIYDFFPKKIVGYYMEFAYEAMGADKELVRYETYSGTGVKYNELLYNRPLKDKQGKIIGIVGNIVDVNYLKQTAVKLFNINDNLGCSEKTKQEVYCYLENCLQVTLKNMLNLVSRLEVNIINKNDNNTIIVEMRNYLKELLHNSKNIFKKHNFNKGNKNIINSHVEI